MKPPVALFKKKIIKFYLFLKGKSLSTQLYVVCIRERRKEKS